MKHDPIPSSWIHPMECGCEVCRRVAPAPIAPIAPARWARWALAGIVTGNAIAFAWDWRGAADALAACFGAVR